MFFILIKPFNSLKSVLDGQFNDALSFLQPFESNYNYDAKEVHYIINKYKFIELLCIKSECGFQNTELAAKEIFNCLSELERFCTCKEEYNKFCMLLTLPSLDQHPDFQVFI